MLTVLRSGQFKRDVKRARKRGKDLAKRRGLLALLIEEKSLLKADLISMMGDLE